MKDPTHYLVELGPLRMTLIGGPCQPDGPDHLWLTSPDGERLLRVPRHSVHPSTPEQTAARIVEDMRHAREERQAALAARN